MGNGPLQKARTDRKKFVLEIKQLKVENDHYEIKCEAARAGEQVLQDRLDEEQEKKK